MSMKTRGRKTDYKKLAGLKESEFDDEPENAENIDKTVDISSDDDQEHRIIKQEILSDTVRFSMFIVISV